MEVRKWKIVQKEDEFAIIPVSVSSSFCLFLRCRGLNCTAKNVRCVCANVLEHVPFSFFILNETSPSPSMEMKFQKDSLHKTSRKNLKYREAFLHLISIPELETEFVHSLLVSNLYSTHELQVFEKWGWMAVHQQQGTENFPQNWPSSRLFAVWTSLSLPL